MTPSHRVYLGLAAGVPLLVALAACSPLTVINAMSSAGGAVLTPDLAYGSGPRNKLDIYRPKDAAGPAPVVVFFYGGNWTSGQRADYAFVGRALAARGIVTVIADYRLYPEVRYPDFLDDSARAVAWTYREVARYGGDPQRLFVMGHSAGAYNAAMIALDARWLGKQGLSPQVLRGWIGLAGPYDFLPIENRQTRPVFDFPNTPADSQPIHHAGAGVPPALLIAARKDSLVDPQRNTGGLAARLRDDGDPVSEQYVDGVNHETLVASLAGPLRWLAPTLDEVQRFVMDTGARAGPHIAPPA